MAAVLPDLLTASEARALIRVSRNTFYGMIGRREIKVVKIGRKILIPESEIERLVERSTVPARRSFFKA